ncbi:MAG: hypothetical protein M1827_004640 [Pycnora praestabilis]|nr:MAG: hypothetical protein M1827_004640 [Pycnora praestabilis]
MSDGIHSHGRGGQGNIGPDSSTYVDGEIIREGVAGESADGGALSTGRGGAGNVASPGLKPTTERRDSEVIPETAIRRPGEEYDNYHVGRGGEGNIHKEKATHQQHDGLADKLKKKLFGDKKDKESKSPEPGI